MHWHWARNSSKIDSGTKQPHSRERPCKRIPQRILAVFHSNHSVVCPWIIQNSLNQWKGFKTTVAQYHNGYCQCTVLWISKNIFLITKTGAWILLFHAACTFLSTQQGHIEDGIKAKHLLFFFLLCCSYKHGVNTYIFPASWCHTNDV